MGLAVKCDRRIGEGERGTGDKEIKRSGNRVITDRAKRGTATLGVT